MKRTLSYIFMAVFALSFMGAGGQTLDQLRAMMQKYEDENRMIDGLIKDTKKERAATEREIQMMLTRISNSRQIVTSIDRQIEERHRRVSVLNTSIGRYGADQKRLRAEYADMVRAAYRNYKQNTFLLFLFAADDFNEASKRVYFMRRYNQAREQKAAEIKGVTDSLAVLAADLKTELAELDKTKQARNSELSTLRSTEKEHRVVADQLKKKERTLSTEKKQKQKLIDAAQKKIAEMVAEEARKARGQTLTAAQKEYNANLTGRFGQNKGNLPYPSKGVVIERFNTSEKLTNPNPGIKIATAAGIPVNAVFEGKVVSVFSRTGINNGVMVNHGDYWTLYANLVSVSVRMGDTVSLGQKLGTLPAGGDPENHYLFFQIWKNNVKGDPTPQNPELWLRR